LTAPGRLSSLIRRGLLGFVGPLRGPLLLLGVRVRGPHEHVTDGSLLEHTSAITTLARARAIRQPGVHGRAGTTGAVSLTFPELANGSIPPSMEIRSRRPFPHAPSFCTSSVCPITLRARRTQVGLESRDHPGAREAAGGRMWGRSLGRALSSVLKISNDELASARDEGSAPGVRVGGSNIDQRS